MRSSTGTIHRLGTAAVVVVLSAMGLAGAAQAKGGEVGGSGPDYYLTNTATGAGATRVGYGLAGDRAYVGDWDGDGVDTLAVRRASTFYVRNSVSAGPADRVFAYGRADDEVYVGDWDGDGTDTLAVRRGNMYHVRNSLTGGAAELSFAYGSAHDVVLVGDWDGDGTDSLAVRRGRSYHLRNSLSAGPADRVVDYGRVSDRVLVGDWDGDGDDTLTVHRGRTYLVKNALTGGPADRELAFGREADAAFAGDWDGNTIDTLGVRRGACTDPGTTENQSSGRDPLLRMSTVTGSALSVAPLPCVERVVLEFRGSDAPPGWQAAYVDLIRNEESGQSVQPPFAAGAFLHVTFAAWFTGEPAGRPPFMGPDRLVLREGYDALRDVRVLGGFEGISDIGIGLDEVRPYRVTWLRDPVRLVVDVYTG
ncbi:hypothetical protein AA0Y32_13850 [Georgenia phoenicis]|uniref:AMIN-like domain-containing (lipo)protein n=1 Tax=unclassified Georgenia TaxID=2626815 RepID=UPI0039B0EE67